MNLGISVLALITLVQLIAICLMAARIQELENLVTRHRNTITRLSKRLREGN